MTDHLSSSDSFESDEKSDSLSFKEFFDSEENLRVLPAQGENIAFMAAAISSPFLSALGASKSKQKQFAKEVSDVSLSDSFISQFSDKVGTPAPGESEDAFVRRAKTVLREVLRARFRNW